MKDLRRKLKKLFIKYWPVISIFLLVGIFFWKVFLLNQVPIPADFLVGTYYPWLDYKWGYLVGVPVKNPITTDVVSFTYPMRTLGIELLKKSQLPLWNPYILTGIPLMANFQSAPFTFTNIFYFVFDGLTAWSFQIMSQHFLVMLFTYLLLRNWKLSKISSLVGGLIFSFGGFNLIWSQWNAHVLSASFIPLLVLLEDRWIKKGKWYDGFLFAFSIFLQVISGYPQIVFYTFIAVFLYWLVIFENTKIYWLRSTILGIFAFLGIGLVSLELIPAAELLSFSQRGVESLEFSWAFLPWSKIITFIAPDFFGNHATQNYWGPTDYTTTTGFIGVVSMTLFGLSFPLIKKNKKLIYGISLVAISLLLSFPTPISIYIWKSGFFGFQAASAHRALVLFVLGIAILSSSGFERLISGRKISFNRALIIPGLLLSLFTVYSLISYLNPEFSKLLGRGILEKRMLNVSLRNLVLPWLVFVLISFLFIFIKRFPVYKKFGIAIIIVVLTLEIFRFGWKFTPFSPRNIVYPTTPILDFLLKQKKPFRATANEVIPMNLAMQYGIEFIEGYDAIYPLDIAQFIAAINSGRPDTSPQGRYGTVSNQKSQLLNLVNTKYIITIKRNEKGNPEIDGNIPKEFKNSNYKVAFEDKTTVIVENMKALPRAFVVYDWDFVKDKREVLSRLLEKDFPYEKRIILEDQINDPKPQKGEFVLNYRKYSEQESIIDVNTSTDGFLFLSDLYYPGWKAYVDGTENKIYKADYTFRAIGVPKGQHEVKFIYRPESFSNGLKLSAISLFSLTVLSFAVSLIGKKKKLNYT